MNLTEKPSGDLPLCWQKQTKHHAGGGKMAHDSMYECEAKRPFIENGVKVRKWTVVSATTLESGGIPEIRCRYCHGAIRVHKQRVAHGPADHVEHISTQDSRHCKGGVHFCGEHQMSLNPIE